MSNALHIRLKELSQVVNENLNWIMATPATTPIRSLSTLANWMAVVGRDRESTIARSHRYFDKSVSWINKTSRRDSHEYCMKLSKGVFM